MRVDVISREYPPEVYGGAGVHVTELVAQLRRLCAVDVHCMGAPRLGAFAHQPDPRLHGANFDHVTAISTGYGHSCALRQNQTVWCWGWGEAGQLGSGGRPVTSA